MKNSNSFKLGLGLVVSLTLGLSSCNMDSPFGGSNEASERMMSTPSEKTSQNNASTNTMASKTASKAAEPVQPSTPGPKRTAAPQIPVIQ